MITNILLGIIAFFLLALVIQFGVLLQRNDNHFSLGCKLSSINSKAQSILDTLNCIENAVGANGCLEDKLLKKIIGLLDEIKANTMLKVHTPSVWFPKDSDFMPPQDVKGVTATGICQECSGKMLCQFYDVNRNRCYVADKKITNKKDEQ